MPFWGARSSILRIAASATMAILLSLFAVHAQSSDVRSPTVVTGNEIVGVVPVRDIGDARLTDHFYTFNGLPGDILVTIESKNLNGDFDIFTAAELRPLLKATVYAETATAITKNIYLRKPESLILRVEARTPNDDAGNYRIRFSGSFAALENRSTSTDAATPREDLSQPTRTGNRKTTRVSSSGARIDEPLVEVAAAPTPEPTPAPSTEENTTPVAKVTPPRSPRGRRTPARVTPRKPVKPSDQTATTTSTSEESASKPANNVDESGDAKRSASAGGASTETTVPRAKPVPARRSPAKPVRGPRVTKSEVTAENGRLIIEVKDGSRIEYLMSTVTRLTVENGEVVIVSDDGYTKRVPLMNVLRMSIAP